MTKHKHPNNRAERRKIKSLATSRFRDHTHLNETKKYIKEQLKAKELEDELYSIESSSGYAEE